MKKKYKVYHTWHSGECFGATMRGYDICEVDEDHIEEWKKEYQEDYIDGSYKSIDSMVELNEDEDI